MKRLSSATALGLLLLASFPAHAVDREVEIEMRRIEERVQRTDEINKQLLQDMRQIQRYVQRLEEQNKELKGKIEDLTDSVIKIKNIDISNLEAGQKGLYDQVPNFTWGQDTEACDTLEAKHQQIEAVKSEDGTRTLRFLCFDGKALHLGTELNTPLE